ncbi:MAG: sigma 54-interacting transcriptional regulator, partial [Acidobacteria bacterium]|nr:sigma 54-interacting transcriptional regulator [Acidobacteriota bacterium]
TLFLDEIGELALGVQAKVLRVLEERTFERVGGGVTLRSDARLVAATNRDLRKMVDEGRFRADLFYRLEIFPIEIPPLRHRRSDVPLLARHLLGVLADRHGLTRPQLTEEAATYLSEQPWPGNVRELANLLERAVIVCDSRRLGRTELQELSEPSEEGEKERICRALEECGGDKKRAAELLGISYRTLQRRVQRYDLEGFPAYREPLS